MDLQQSEHKILHENIELKTSFQLLENKGERKQFILWLRNSGKTQNEIAGILNIGRGKVRYMLNEIQSPTTIGDLHRSDIARVYRETESIEETAKILNLGSGTVSRWLKKLGIEATGKAGRKRKVENISTGSDQD